MDAYLYVHYIILFALCIFEVFDNKVFLFVFLKYYHSPVG